MVVVAAANAIPQTSCLIDQTIYYGSGNLVLSWRLGATNAESLAILDGQIDALCVGKANKLLIGTNSGKFGYLDIKTGDFDQLGHLERPITCVSYNSSTDQCAVGCMNGHIYIYSECAELYPIKLKGYPLCVAFCLNLLVVGGTTSKIYLHHLDTNAHTVLDGHENWVRSLSFRKDSESKYTLASASQEKYVRLWQFSSEPAVIDEFSTASQLGEWSITFEALLVGHDDWVVSVQWDPFSESDPALLTASSDSSLIIWRPETEDLWTPETRLGDVSTWGASTATGTSGGFWSALWLPDAVATVSKTGSFRIWQRSTGKPEIGLTGHFQEVTDIAWFDDNFLLSTSLDQTTRLWHVNTNDSLLELREIGRPQIHGYDMMAVASIDDCTFVSGGDEKIMRIFELPKQVAEQMHELGGKSRQNRRQVKTEALPMVAGVPALGLSNKPEAGEEVIESLPAYPREDHLQRLTLWPEKDKLYGHGYEISTIAVSPQLSKIVSCCRANSEKHAQLKFFSLKDFLEIQRQQESDTPGPTHSLTVTRLSMSPDGERVLSVSRDRKFMITNVSSQEVEVELLKAHTRIIWDGCWLNSSEFITGSRDKSVKKWKLLKEDDGHWKVELNGSQKFNNPVTAVAAGGNWIAVGEENGTVTLWNTELNDMLRSFALPGKVNRLAISETLGMLAAASGCSIQIFPIS